MSSEKFTVDDSMSAGWHLLSEHFWTYTRLASLAFLLMFLPDMASFAIGFNSNFAFLTVVFTILGIVLKGIVPMGLIYIQLRLIDGQPASSDDFWKPASKYFAFIGASLIYLWVVAFGLLFFIVPGIIFGIMFQFYPFFIVEHKLGPLQALKASSDITSGAMWELLLLGILLMVIQGIAGLFFIFGAVPAAVFTIFTVASVYRTLLKNTPMEELSFSYNRDALSPAADARKQFTEIATIDSSSNDQGDTLNVGGNLQTPEHQAANMVESTQQHHQEQPVGSSSEHIDSKSDDNRTDQAIVSTESIGYDQPAKDGVKMDPRESDSAKPVDNSPGENDKTANQF